MVYINSHTVERSRQKMIKLLKNLPKRNWLMMFFAIGFVVLQVWLDLTIPDYMADITALVQTDGSKMADIWKKTKKCCFVHSEVLRLRLL